MLVGASAALVGALAIALLTTPRDGGTPLALGAAGGSFHPVAGSFQPDGTIVAECGSDLQCLAQALGNVAYRRGPKVALALLEGRLERDGELAARCHPVVHVIGSATLARERGNVAKAFALGSSTCASGYYHGILERAFVGLHAR